MNLNQRLNSNYNHKRIYQLMKSINLQFVIRRKKKRYVTSTPEIVSENILNREFKADSPNEKWLTDVTEFKLTKGRKVYLSAILDLGDNSRVSYVLSTSNNNKLVFDTFDLAISKNPDAHPLFHSDRVFQYTHKTFKLKLDKKNAIQSMSMVSRCIDNGPMEGFWGIIKSEMCYLSKFHTFDGLKLAVDDYIEFYNEKRLQKKLNCLAPLEFRNQALFS